MVKKKKTVQEHFDFFMKEFEPNPKPMIKTKVREKTEGSKKTEGSDLHYSLNSRSVQNSRRF